MTPTATAILDAAKSQLGVPYQFGGERPRSSDFEGAFDCSGLVQWSYGRAGINVPRTSEEQWTCTELVTLQPDQVLDGDLVFFVGAPKDPPPGHVGIVCGAGQFIDAPETGETVSIQDFDASTAFGLMGYRGYRGANTEPDVPEPPAPAAIEVNVQLPELRENSTGHAVVVLQELLHVTPVDGVFGAATKTAVEKFQGGVKITADGIAGPVTWRHLLVGTA